MFNTPCAQIMGYEKKTEPQRLYSERDPIWSPHDMGSIPHGDSECFLCSMLVTRQKPSLSIFLPSSKLSIFLIMLKNKALFPQVFFQMCESYVKINATFFWQSFILICVYSKLSMFLCDPQSLIGNLYTQFWELRLKTILEVH